MDASTTYEQAIGLVKEIEKELNSDKKFIEKCKFKELTVGKLFYIIVHIKNLQNAKEVIKTQHKLIAIFTKVMKHEGIQFSNSFVFTD